MPHFPYMWCISIKTCKKYHLNTIVLQVRPTNDALYKSKLNPYSKYLNKERKEGHGA